MQQDNGGQFQRERREQRTLRIGIVCPYSLSIPGGVQAQVMGLARELRSMGYEARVIGPCDGPPPATFVSPVGNSLPTASNGSVVPIAPDPSAQFRTIQLLNDENFDVLHVHEPLAPGAAQTALFLHPAPIVGTFHAAGESTSYKLLTAPLSRLADNISHRVVVSKDALALVQGYMGGDYEVLFNGVELHRFRQAASHTFLNPTIFFCGRHEDRKGLDILLEAFETLPANVRLVIASNGPDTKRLQQQYATDTRIEWVGRITDDEKMAYLKGSAVFCAPSLRGESFGVVLLEAMAAGTPVVASSLDGYMNVATHEVDSLLCAPGDVAELAAALQRVVNDGALSDRLRNAGEQRAEQFSMSALAARYAEIYEQLAREHPIAQPTQPGSVPRLRAALQRMMH
ncbi:MAG: glycosyltransferase family 4 protein [Actinomycetota bacterium]